MKRKLIGGFAALALVVVGAAAADTANDALVLHPVSTGALADAGWQAQEGRPDSLGQANQALVLEATGTPDTSAAGVFRGFEGVRIRDLKILAYDDRVPATCAKTDPRWTLFVQGRGAKTYLVNLGCAVTPAHATGSPNWVQRVFTSKVIQAEIVRQVPKPAVSDALNGTIEQLALVVDRSKGPVYLDNIEVRTVTKSKTWTFAGDNGRGVSTDGIDLSADQRTMLAAPLPEEALWDEDAVLASITSDEQALIDEANAS